MKYLFLSFLAFALASAAFAQTPKSSAPPKGKTQEQLAYEALYKGVEARRDSVSQNWDKLTPEQKEDTLVTNAFKKQYDDLSKESHQISRVYLETHSSSPYALDAIKEVDNGAYILHPELVDPLFKKLSPAIQQSKEGKAFAARIEKAKKLDIGMVAPAFSAPDTAGKSVALKDFRGKYVLVDFWASWCKPCRAENPNVLKAYNKYKDKNFTVLGVSVDSEKAKEAWLKAISDDGMPWTQISDLKAWSSPAAVLYDVHAIPQNYLLDPSGKIVAKNIRGEKLYATLEGIFGK